MCRRATYKSIFVKKKWASRWRSRDQNDCSRRHDSRVTGNE
jgi:hypothetical protein